MAVKYIGVLSRVTDPAILKRASLLFDEVLYEDTESGLNFPRRHVGMRPGLAAAVRSAIASGIAYDFTGDKKTLLQFMETQLQVYQQAQGEEEERSRLQAMSSGIHDLYARYAANVLQTVNRNDVIIPLMLRSELHTSPECSRTTVIRVVLNGLPLPASSTPWSAIDEWRQDAEARNRYAQLRAWIAKTAQRNITGTDVSEELAGMLASYQQYMAVQHKKIRRSRLEAVVIPLAEFLEDMLHVRVSRVVEKLCGVFREETQVLDVELHAPGREVAYIVAANERLRGETNGRLTSV